MTREEAAKRWEWVIENFNDSSVYLWPDQRQELLASIALLRGPQPDPITGLVPCGGRRAVLWFTTGEGFWAACCGVSQANRYETKAFAIKAWNESIGYTAPPRPGAIGQDAGEMDPNGDEGEEL